MVKQLIGREKELEILQDAFDSEEAELVAVIGRRRIGKTFLIKSAYAGRINFELTGTKNAPLNEQLKNFVYAINLSFDSPVKMKAPKDWMEAFFMLIQNLKRFPEDERKVVFLDELPWLTTHKSGFIRALSFFWNSWAVNQNIVVVICGSAASWMIQKVVNDVGGLHNRITRRVHLRPFTLYETEQFLKKRKINLNRFQLLQIFMVMGGIPHYLKEIKAGKSAIQNIEDTCFEPNGLLFDEFSNLYSALFEHAGNHIEVVRALATKKMGLERNEIMKIAQSANGGGLSKVLEELQQSGFIEAYQPYGKKKKERLYRLVDEYSLFYLQFIENNAIGQKDNWQRFSQTPAYHIWCGYAFESICLKHIQQIKDSLRIAGVFALAASFYKKGKKEEQGAQIDLVLDRNDQIIHIFEIKFRNKALSISKDLIEEMQRKIEVFEAHTKTKKHILKSLITTFGISQNEYSLGYFDQVLSLDDLFKA
jgi:hypothetical protein